MLTYVSRFLSGDLEPFWPHVALLSASVLASIAVGGGIIFERPTYSAAVHRVAFWLVVVGIAIEAVCTIFLFVFDEGISSAQQSTIGALTKEVANAQTGTKAAMDNASAAMHHAEDAEAQSNFLLQENLKLRAKLADREVSSEARAIIRQRLKGENQEVTIVVSGMREPQVYAASIGKALEAAGFKVVADAWTDDIPPDTGVVFCQNRPNDRKIYDVLRLARVATRFVGSADKRPDFCDKPGIEAPIEDIIDRLSAGILTPENVGRLIPHGTLAKWHGPRIFVGQKEQ